MFLVSFQTSAVAIAQIFAIGAVGFTLVHRRIVDEAGLKLLSFLSVNIAFPLFIFYQILLNFLPDQTPLWWCYPLVNIGLTLSGLVLTACVCAVFGLPIKARMMAGASLHNAGYIPLLMVMTLPWDPLNRQIYAAIIMSIIGFDLCLWSLGVWLVTREQSPRMALKKMLNPPLLSMMAAVLLVFLGKPLMSETFLKPVKIIGDSAMALAMLTIGGNLAMTKLKNIQLPLQLTLAVIIKLALLPLMALITIVFLKPGPLISFVLILQSCMPTSITLSIIGRHYGTKNQDFINQCIFFTHILCVITIPIFLGIYGHYSHK